MHPQHGDCPPLNAELSNAASLRGIAHTRIPDVEDRYYTNLTKRNAPGWLKNLPGGAGFYRSLTKVVLRRYKEVEI